MWHVTLTVPGHQYGEVRVTTYLVPLNTVKFASQGTTMQELQGEQSLFATLVDAPLVVIPGLASLVGMWAVAGAGQRDHRVRTRGGWI